MTSGSTFPALFFSFAVTCALSAIMFGVLYWVVRLAVRHAIEDADRRRASEHR
ncbi:hypothetical protein [Micromonospora sonneratiae]|jgi:hypothetical protein|uniref:Heme exporter protein D n=1 Tax=Micromonospora sonneratiae TaxID=1184706 RepID=A0ABW3Y953_9ACTN